MLINAAREGAVLGHTVPCHFYYLSDLALALLAFSLLLCTPFAASQGLKGCSFPWVFSAIVPHISGLFCARNKLQPFQMLLSEWELPIFIPGACPISREKMSNYSVHFRDYSLTHLAPGEVSTRGIFL